jgi:hypothetical protein
VCVCAHRIRANCEVQKLGVLVSPLRAHRPPVVLAQPSASPANILARALFHIDPEHLHAVPYTSSPCAPTSHNQCFAANHGSSSCLLKCFAAFFLFFSFLDQNMAFLISANGKASSQLW